MKSYSIKYDNFKNLESFIKINKIDINKNILVQIFTGICNKNFITELIFNITSFIPKCKIIGATSSSEIYGGKSFENTCIISITIFENTEINTLLLGNKEDDFNMGRKISNTLINDNTKVIISFISMEVDGQIFLDGINSENQNIPIAGGVAGGEGIEGTSYIFTQDGIEEEGVAAVALNSTSLYVNNESSCNWTPIGKEHEITEANGRFIQSIDNINAVEFYKKYVGVKDNGTLNYIGTQFPLMIETDGAYISRPIMIFTHNNELVLASNVKKGQKVKIGYGNFGEILRGSRDVYSKVKEYPVESIFIYSCLSRKMFLKNFVDVELEPILNFPEITGFYTYGEFNYIKNKNVFYTVTMTMLMMSEDANAKLELDSGTIYDYDYYTDEELALYHLVKTTGEELNELNIHLEEKVREKTIELNEQYYKDSLTNLPNRNRLISDLEYKKYNRLAILNIDSFKDINDFYGNEFGDFILIELSKIIKNYCNKNNFISYRAHGDIFAVTDIPNSGKDFVKKIKELQNIINVHLFLYKDLKINLTISIGLVEDNENLIEKAEMALNYGKNYKKNFEIYKNELNLYEKIKENLEWTRKIKDAIAQDRIVPYFQPIVNNQSGSVEKFEALIRMVDDNGDIISPFYFLDIAKKSGLYIELAKIMIEKTFDILDKVPYEVSINLLNQDIINPTIRSLITEKLKKSKNSKKLVFEIVESEGIENYDIIISFINEVKKFGVKIAIDDFGTGYSNFDYLMKLNIDYIKIDGSIIKKIITDKSAEILVKTLVNFAKELKIKTIGEFVSHREIFDKINALNIDFSQGYYFSEPVSSISNLEILTNKNNDWI